MPWTPSTTLLGTVKEFENFSYSIQYYEEVAGEADPISGLAGPSTITYYPVNVIPESVKATITTSNGDPATIAGFYKYIFYDVVNYRGYNNNIAELTGDENQGAWEKLNIDVVFEMTDFSPDRVRDRSFSFTANAMNGSTVLASQVFTVRVYDPNWTNGKNALQAAVAATIAKD